MKLDDPNAYGANWYEPTRVASPPRGKLTVELDVDVCVVGAGLAGLTVAREVARLGWSVVVLESKTVAWNASGRNAGVVRPGFAISASELVGRVGPAHAKALWARSEAGVEYVRNAAQSMKDVALSESGWLHVSKTDDPAAMAAEAALLVGEFGAAVEPWPADRVRDVLRSTHYFHALHYPRGFSLHALNYALGLATAAEEAGARIFEDTPVLEIDPAGVRKRIVTRDSRIRAGHVVLAGNVHLAGLAPQFSCTLTPVFTTVIATAPLGDELQEAIRFPGAVSDSDMAGHHHRVVEGRRLLWSGRSTVSHGRPKRHAGALVRQIRRTYPQLRNAKVEQAWSGVSGRTVHGMPQIGEISPGLWLLGGFGGHGLNTTAMAGEAVARAIVEGDRSWQMFSPFALVWAGGGAGRMAQQASGWLRRSRERLAYGLARRRDRKRRRIEAAEAAAAAAAAAVVASPPVAPEVTQPPPEPAFEPIAEPVEAAVDSAPAAVAEQTTSEVPEGQSGAAAPAIPDALLVLPDLPVEAPVKPKRKRKKTLRAASAETLAEKPSGSDGV